MPILNPDGSPVRQKQWEHSKRKIKDQLAQMRAAPATPKEV